MSVLITALLGLGALIAPANSHSWVEQMQVIGDNGSYTGAHGYPRGYIVRDDQAMTVLSPPDGQGRIRLDTADSVCAPSQSTPNSNTAAWPALVAMPGNYVALKHLENGHVTRTESYVGNISQIGKPGSAGLVYIYGTTNTAAGNHTLADVASWTATSPLSQGRLLAINNFDDGRCYQISNSPDFAIRAAANPDPVSGQPGSQHEQWCETNFQVPSDAPAGSSMALYWVWQWPTLPNMDPSVPVGKDESYTCCADVKIAASPADLAAAQNGTPHPDQDPNNKAVAAYKDRAANVTCPANPAFYGPNSPVGRAAAGGSSSSSPGPASAPGATANGSQPTAVLHPSPSGSALPSNAAPLPNAAQPSNAAPQPTRAPQGGAPPAAPAASGAATVTVTVTVTTTAGSSGPASTGASNGGGCSCSDGGDSGSFPSGGSYPSGGSLPSGSIFPSGGNFPSGGSYPGSGSGSGSSSGSSSGSIPGSSSGSSSGSYYGNIGYSGHYDAIIPHSVVTSYATTWTTTDVDVVVTQTAQPTNEALAPGGRRRAKFARGVRV